MSSSSSPSRTHPFERRVSGGTKSSSSSPSRSSEIRRDVVFDRWVVFSPARARRPSNFKSHAPASNPNPMPSCPFCIGRESECTPEIFRLPAGCGASWKIRVIENLYLALRRDTEPAGPEDAADADGPVRLVLPGFGFHDVVIETPYHSVHLPDLSPPEVGEVLLAFLSLRDSK